MNGTSFSHTLAIFVMPPRITTAVSTVMTLPVIQGETPNVCCARPAMELACVMLPIPKAAMAVSAANSMPSGLLPSPRSRAYMGPPAIWPLASFTRYFTLSTASAYFVAMPNTPVSHIHNTAPGPPAATAVATPTMLPVPIVAASAVVSAPNWLISPSPSFSRENDSLMACGRYVWMNFSLKVRNRCVPKSKIRSGGPQTKSLAWARTASMACMGVQCNRTRHRGLPAASWHDDQGRGRMAGACIPTVPPELPRSIPY